MNRKIGEYKSNDELDRIECSINYTKKILRGRTLLLFKNKEAILKFELHANIERNNDLVVNA